MTARGPGFDMSDMIVSVPDSSCAMAAPDKSVEAASAATLVLVMDRMVSSLVIRFTMSSFII